MSLLGKFNELQHAYRFAPTLKLSQNFLMDESVLQKIVEAAQLSPKDTVLEIGAGTGFLTSFIAPQCKKVIAVEFDQHLHDLLEAELPKNAELLKGDILSIKLPPFDKIVSTPPYDISSMLMHKLFHWKFSSAVLVFQLEFVEKLVASPGFPNYHAISVLCQYYFEPTPLFSVKSGSFFPKPSSDSGCIRLISKKRFGNGLLENPILGVAKNGRIRAEPESRGRRKEAFGRAKNDEHFELFVEHLFRFKNKNIEKALYYIEPFLKKENIELKPFDPALDKLGLKGKKVYSLEVFELVQLFNELVSK